MRRTVALLSRELESKSYFVASRDKKHTLHLRRIRTGGETQTGEAAKPVCLLFHGAIENGRIYYSKSNKGLAPYLARNNCDVFVADYRGRGESTPPIRDFADHGQTELINDDMLSLCDGVRDITNGRKQHWVAHSWGGILCGSALARYPQYADYVASQVWLGAKRTISVTGWERFLRVTFFWRTLFPALAKVYGYIPAKKFRLGGDDEPLRYVTEVSEWITKPDGDWKDVDGFDFRAAADAMPRYPPTWSIAGQGDHVLGNPIDVLRFVDEHKTHRDAFKYSILGKKQGNLHDYDHVNMLTHRDVEKDHAPQILQWIKEHEQGANAKGQP